MSGVRGSLRACEPVLRLAALLVPRRRRADWLREWRAELWHEALRLAESGRVGPGATAHLVGRSLGGFPDAAAVRRFHPAPAQEDVVSALSVVLRSPGAAGAAVLLIAMAIMADLVAVTVSRFVALVPPSYRPFLLGLNAALVVLLALAACVAAAAAVAWSDAARREAAVRRAMGVPESRLRRQRALEGVFIALMGSALGVWLGSGLVGKVRWLLEQRGAAQAAASLDANPRAGLIGLGLAVLTTALLALAASLRRHRPVLD